LTKLAYPYKNETNQKYSKQLFFEQWRTLPFDQRTVEPPFTLNSPKDGYVCLREEYIKDGDPTGYKTAIRIFGDFTYWEYLCSIRWFKEAKESWDRELDAKLSSEGIGKIRELAKGDDPKALNAAKFLAVLEYKKGGSTIKPKRGRPSNDEVEGRLKEEARNRTEIDEDAERIKLVV
jgi:hypothetical protein